MNASHFKYLFFGHLHPSCSPCIFLRYTFSCSGTHTHYFIQVCKKKSICMKINNDSNWDSRIARGLKHCHFHSKAIGLCDRSSSMLGWGKFYVCACGYPTTHRQALLVGAGRQLLPICAVTHCSTSCWPLGDLSCLCQSSGSHAVVVTPPPPTTSPQGHWWGSKWSSRPSPSPWQGRDSPACIRCWQARGKGLWSPNGRYRYWQGVRHPLKTKHKHHSSRMVNIV